MRISDFVNEDGYGLCCSTPFEDGELVLSQCFDNGTHGVRQAVDMVLEAASEGPVVASRYGMIQTMCAAEADSGMLVTGKGGGAIASIKREWGMRRNLARKKVPLAMSLVLSLASLQAREYAKHA